jgi:hypothetical protein
MNDQPRVPAVLFILMLVFVVLTVSFSRRKWMEPEPLKTIALVDPELVQPTTMRTSYVQLVRMQADLSDFDCYACHEKNKPPPLRFDASNNIVIPKEHSDLVMAHGQHNRNNNCFNCHDEQNLVMLTTRDGRQVKFEDSPRLCGSCHGPTYRDWEGGAHGRTGGYWKKEAGEMKRQICVDCHNPHSPKIPPRTPLPPPHPLHRADQARMFQEFRQPEGVAQTSSLPYRGFPIRRCDQAVTTCRLEVGDTAGWKPALRSLGSPLGAAEP